VSKVRTGLALISRFRTFSLSQ